MKDVFSVDTRDGTQMGSDGLQYQQKRSKNNSGGDDFEIGPPSRGYWTAVPLFLANTYHGRGNYPSVATGGYVLPLFEGEIPRDLINASKGVGGK